MPESRECNAVIAVLDDGKSSAESALAKRSPWRRILQWSNQKDVTRHERSRRRSTSLVLFSALTAFAICAFGEVQDIQVVQVPVVTGARIQFFRLPWPSTRFVVKKIIQDNQGFLWLGAADGLRRYDGYGFMRVPESEDPQNIDFIIAESLMKDRSGRIWFGADDSLGRYDPVTGNIKQYRSRR